MHIREEVRLILRRNLFILVILLSYIIILNGDTMVTEAKIRTWGNSLGIVIPQDLVNELGITAGEEIILDVQKKGTVLKELFGAIPLKRKTKNILIDVRKELEGKFI